MYDLASEFNISTNYSLSPKFNAMMGFTEEEVRKMLTYYSTNSPFRHTVDELIGMMKPWYNNYCFAKECHGETTMYNSNIYDASIIQTLVSQGFITGELKGRFPTAGITNPDNFVSLLYYFGMLTISGMHEGKTKLTIPNMVVQEQLYTYLLNTYNVCQVQRPRNPRGRAASGSHCTSQPLRRYGHGETCHRQHPAAQDCSG